MTRGSHTLAEIESQPEAWAETLAQLRGASGLDAFAPDRFDEVVFTGCGSTYYLAVAAATLFQQLNGVPARGLPASELWLRPDAYLSPRRRTLLVAVSRSGNTTETVRAVAAFRERTGGAVLTLSCYPESELADLGDLDLVLTAGQEKSIAQTRAFSVLYLATTYIALNGAGAGAAHVEQGAAQGAVPGVSLDGEPRATQNAAPRATPQATPYAALAALPAACRRLIDEYRPLAARRGSDTSIERFYVLGSGPRYGLASELSLKLKEMTLSHSEPFHFLEFRHGPQSMVTEQTLLIGLLSEGEAQSERAVLEQMRARGAQVLSLAEHDADVTFASGVPESLRNVLYLPIIQLLAFERSLAKGLDPDRPQNLEAVVMLE